MTAGGKDVAADDHQIIIDIRSDTPQIEVERASVPFLDLPKQHQRLETEILARWTKLLRSASFIGGAAVNDFEEELAKYLGVREVVGVANGTDAIMLALRGLGIERGDEVIIPANTFFATAEAVVHAGGAPVLVDVDEDTATMDPGAVEAAITDRTRFIVPVHLYGQPADMAAIMDIAYRHDLLVVEDNAQAIGARFNGKRTGSIGHASATSFYPGKNLGAAGDGGAVASNDKQATMTARTLAVHGSVAKYDHELVGYNSRLDAIHAAVLSIKLGHLDAWNARRRYVADRYRTLIDHEGIEHPATADGRTHVYHLYVVRLAARDAVQAALGRHGIATGLHYPVPIHLTAPFENLGHGRGTFPNAERWATMGLSLPMFPEMSDEQIDAVAQAMNEVLSDQHVLTRDSA